MRKHSILWTDGNTWIAEDHVAAGICLYKVVYATGARGVVVYAVCGTREESFPGNPSHTLFEWRWEAGVFSWELFHLCTYVHFLSVEFTYF